MLFAKFPRDWTYVAVIRRLHVREGCCPVLLLVEFCRYEYSRYIVHDKLLLSIDGKSMAIELQAAVEKSQSLKPRVVHDRGSEFVNRDVAAVIKAHNLIDIKTKPRHPESNGVVERFNW